MIFTRNTVPCGVRRQLSSIRVSLMAGFIAGSITLAAGSANAADVNRTPLKDGATPKQVTTAQKNDLHSTMQSSGKNEGNLEGVKPKEIERATELARRINAIPGEKVSVKDLEHAPIKGFHPIQKLVSPVHNLTVSSEKLDKEATKLETPIGDLQQPMLGLQEGMVGVDKNVGHVQHKLASLSKNVTGARSDLADVREDIDSLRGPILSLKKPVISVCNFINHLQDQLNLLIAIIGLFVLLVAFGTPIMGILLFKHFFMTRRRNLHANP